MNSHIEKKVGKLILAVFLIFFILSIFISLLRYIAFENYLVTGKVPCDYATEVCFETPCDLNDPRCSSTGYQYYSIIEKMAFDIPPVDSCSTDENCTLYSCNIDTIEYFELEDTSCVGPISSLQTNQ